MNKILNCCLIAGGLVALGSGASAQIITDDTYWGGLPNDGAAVYQADVIGSASTFDLTGTEYSASGDDVTLKIYGNYFDNILSGNNLFDTDMGDLFISTDGLGSDAVGAATLTDYFGQATHTTFEYAVVLGQYDNAGGVLDGGAVQNAGVYEIDAADTVVYSDKRSYSTFREFQEVTLEPTTQSVGGATWFVDPAGEFLSITIVDFAGLFGSVWNPDIAFHWTMSCGNDVIEVNPVPEPTTIGLLGCAGLLGVLAIRRRIARR